MPFARCNSCYRDVNLPSDTSRPTPRKCLVCNSAFCSMCGQPFICKKCLTQIDGNARAEIMLKAEKYKSMFGGGIAMTVIGGILLIVAAYTSFFSLVFSGARIPFSIAAGVEAVIGLGLLCGGTSSMGNAKKVMVNAVPSLSSSVGATSYGGESPSYYNAQPVAPAWSIAAAAIPSSAYIPPPSNVQPAAEPSMPRSAYIPAQVARQPPVSQASQPSSENARSKTPLPGTYANVSFCGQCGEKLPDVSDLQFCPSCGAPRKN
jgi:hypothetical protein